MQVDPFGVVDGSYFSLMGPPCCDDTSPTLEGAVKKAVELVVGGVEQVHVTNVSLHGEGWDSVAVHGGKVYLTITGGDSLLEEEE